jgi:hypothetical protein
MSKSCSRTRNSLGNNFSSYSVYDRCLSISREWIGTLKFNEEGYWLPEEFDSQCNLLWSSVKVNKADQECCHAEEEKCDDLKLSNTWYKGAPDEIDLNCMVDLFKTEIRSLVA